MNYNQFSDLKETRHQYMDAIDTLKEKLHGGRKRCVIIPHISADGDAAGACSALSLALWDAYHSFKIITCDTIPEYLSFLQNIKGALSYQHHPEECKRFIEDADIIFMLDHNSVTREGDLEPLTAASKAVKVIIDHHLEPDNTDIVISHPEMSSTCEVLYNVMKRIWGRRAISQNIANSLYTGINTDTGGLNHNSSNPAVYRIIAELLENGLDKNFVHAKLYQNNTLSRLRLLGNILLNKLEILPDFPVAIMTITQEEMTQFSFQEGDLEGVVNMPLSIANVLVSIQITERKEQIKLSFRSKNTVPVNEWSKAYFNGGGHLNAAGGRTLTTLQETVQLITDTAPWFFDTYVKEKEENII